MTCPNCGHVYPISNGIPNMVRILRALLQSPLVLIFLRISRFSYWQSTRSGSVLALMREYNSRPCRWFYGNTSTHNLGSTRPETFSLRDTVHVSWMAYAEGTGICTRNVLFASAVLSRDPKQGHAAVQRSSSITPCHREKRARPCKTKTDQVIAILSRCPVMRDSGIVNVIERSGI